VILAITIDKDSLLTSIRKEVVWYNLLQFNLVQVASISRRHDTIVGDNGCNKKCSSASRGDAMQLSMNNVAWWS